MELRAIIAVFVFLSVACTRSAPTAKTPDAAPKITQFYASPPNPPKGEKALVCYGVENATEVRLDPPVERIWPSTSRCFDFVASTEASLTLTARRGSEQVSKTIDLKPGPPEVKLLLVSINKLEFSAGEEVTVCYKARNAASVTIKPGRAFGPQSASAGCIQDRPEKTTTYVVTATGAGGDVDTERVTAKVK